MEKLNYLVPEVGQSLFSSTFFDLSVQIKETL